MQEINIPKIVAEVAAASARYEKALAGNDVAELIELFWESPLTIRFGFDECLYGHAAIAAFRAGRRMPAGGLPREIVQTVVTTYGHDFATTNIEYVRPDLGRTGRQSQSWLRTEAGWRIVSAHVSLMNPESSC